MRSTESVDQLIFALDKDMYTHDAYDHEALEVF